MWTKVDTRFPRHPKVLAAAERQLGPYGHARVSDLWLEGASYANENLTDGFIPRAELKRLSHDPRPFQVADALVAVGLWEPCEGGFRMHDYGDWNPIAAEVKEQQAKHRERQRRYRNGDGGVTRHTTEHETRQVTRDVTHPVTRHVTQLSQGDRARDPVPSRPDTVPSRELHTEPEDCTDFGGMQADEAWQEFQETYPANRVQAGYLALQGFLAACRDVGYPSVKAALLQHKRSEQWQNPAHIPNAQKWFEEQRYRQVLPEAATGADAQARAQEKARQCLADLDQRRAVAARAS